MKEFIFLLCLFVPATIQAQQRSKGLEPIYPAEEHKQLNRLVGTWDVVVEAQFEPGKIQEEKATLETKWVLDGRYLQQEYRSEFPAEIANGAERPLFILQYIGYDRHTNEFFEIHLNSMDTALILNRFKSLSNTATLSNNRGLALQGTRMDPTSNAPRRLRSVTTFKDNDHYTLEWYLTDARGKELKAVSMTHTRRK